MLQHAVVTHAYTMTFAFFLRHYIVYNTKVNVINLSQNEYFCKSINKIILSNIESTVAPKFILELGIFNDLSSNKQSSNSTKKFFFF